MITQIWKGSPKIRVKIYSFQFLKKSLIDDCFCILALFRDAMSFHLRKQYNVICSLFNYDKRKLGRIVRRPDSREPDTRESTVYIYKPKNRLDIQVISATESCLYSYKFGLQAASKSGLLQKMSFYY
jgi:hypothetical protein